MISRVEAADIIFTLVGGVRPNEGEIIIWDHRQTQWRYPDHGLDHLNDDVTPAFWVNSELVTGSGGYGARLIRHVAEAKPLDFMYGIRDNGVNTIYWEHGLDFQDNATTDPTDTTVQPDFVLLYDHSVDGDIFRVAPGAYFVMGPFIGHPSQNVALPYDYKHRLHLIGGEKIGYTDDEAKNLLYLQAGTSAAFDEGPLTDYIKGQKIGIENMQITIDGVIGAGKSLSGFITSGHEFSKAVTITNTQSAPAGNDEIISGSPAATLRLRYKHDATTEYNWDISVAGNATDGPLRFQDIENAKFMMRLEKSDDLSATETAMDLYDKDNDVTEKVTVGAADSGGSGFKVLRIPN